MSLIVKRLLRFLPSTSVDVVGYVLFFAPEGETLDYDSSKVDLGIPTSLDANGKFVVSLNDIPEVAALDEGVYQLGVASKDDVGNMSAIKAVTTPLDLVPPDAVDGVEVVGE